MRPQPSPPADSPEPRASAAVRALVAAAVGLVALFPAMGGGPAPAEAKPSRSKGVFEHGCRVQKPQAFLERRSFVVNGMLDGGKHTKAVRWLSEHYGNVDDTVTARWNAQGARAGAKTVQFMGLPISIHEKVAPALACVEKRIRQKCRGKSSYTPKAIGGFRGANTYRGGEISNHLFGIAIDIDPDRNPCCGCVDPWPSHPLCKVKGKSAEDRAALPSCWIKSFERYGFYWLGRDELEDTMHFEFLGDPDEIKRSKAKRAAAKDKPKDKPKDEPKGTPGKSKDEPKGKPGKSKDEPKGKPGKSKDRPKDEK